MWNLGYWYIFTRSFDLEGSLFDPNNGMLQIAANLQHIYCKWQFLKNYVQKASYLKMCRTKLEPRNGSDQTTACISTKFGKSVSFKHTIRTIEAIFNIWPLSQDTGPLGGTPEGSKIVKKFFSIFRFFSVQAVEFMSLPLQKRIGFPKFCLF